MSDSTIGHGSPRTGKVFVGLSGGVDSSVAALLLLRAGYEVEGLFMKNWVDAEDEVCTAAQDLEDARAVCDRLGIPLHTVNFAPEYWDRVFEHFLYEYRAGRTPNPDVLCNREIKFRAFLDHALRLGADHIATGHYARLQRRGTEVVLLKGIDPAKDQSYFLNALSQEQLARVLFPVGELHKASVRRLAAEAGLPTHAKKDSTGICFIGERRFRAFLERFIPARPGDIVDTEGHVVGRHHGVMYYTFGQREGLGIGGVHGAPELPWYVVDKDVTANRLVVAQGHEHPLLFHDELVAGETNWIAGTCPVLPMSCTAKVRYRQADQDCRVEARDDGRLRVVFDRPQRAVTPGQYVVFYRDDVCLGGAVIEERACSAAKPSGMP
ncbi:MAG: tRNA 2-thiouridine(34) synthase MnmA [Chromatiales bacterium]|nr:tRNA 2-thiouridine(34) synthase MnmA [Chromatiales bacterium]MDX9765723.1 tRNA 2-thiouridine(34) synthase MnmA [Ectothiorhodospiraceae bacterium]